MWPLFTVVVSITYPDLSVHTFLQDGMDFLLKGFAKLKPLHSSLNCAYEQYISIKNNNFSVVNFVYYTYDITSSIRSTGFPNADHLLQLHCKIKIGTYISKIFIPLLWLLTLVIGVNIQKLVNFIFRIIKVLILLVG